MDMAKPRGSVQAIATGYRARLQIGKRQLSLGVWPTEDEARQVIQAYLEQMGDAPRGETLRAYGQRWLRDREVSGLVRHVQKERSVWRKHVSPKQWAGLPLREITRRHVATWARELVTGDGAVSRQTAVHALRLLRGCLASAADEGLIRSNPAADVRVPRTPPRAPRWTYLSQDEIEGLLACEQIPQWARCLLTVAIYTGLRKGELWGLRFENMQLDGPDPYVRVARSYDGPVKSEQAFRDVPLLPPARQALDYMRRRGGVRRMHGLVWPRADGGCRRDDDDGGWSDHPETRTTRDGTPYRYTRRGWRSLAGLRAEVRFHDLRHTCASHLVMGTWGHAWTLYEVRDWMGHSSITVTQRYAHLAPDSIRSKARQASERWGRDG